MSSTGTPKLAREMTKVFKSSGVGETPNMLKAIGKASKCTACKRRRRRKEGGGAEEKIPDEVTDTQGKGRSERSTNSMALMQARNETLPAPI